VSADTHHWIFDPDIDGVVGLVSKAGPQQAPADGQIALNDYGVLHHVGGPQAVIVCYLEEQDFECDDEWVFA
jgi:hypothetical protein